MKKKKITISLSKNEADINSEDNYFKVTDAKQIEKLRKGKNISFSFEYFFGNSICINNYFSNYFKSHIQFLYFNMKTYSMIKEISSRNYNEVFTNTEFSREVHAKILDRKPTIGKILYILKNGYNQSIEQWKDSIFVECSVTKGERFIGVLDRFHVVHVLFFDPNHLLCPNENYRLEEKYKYKYPSLMKAHDVDGEKIQIELEKIEEKNIDEKLNECLELLNLVNDDYLCKHKDSKKLADECNFICEEVKKIKAEQR